MPKHSRSSKWSGWSQWTTLSRWTSSISVDIKLYKFVLFKKMCQHRPLVYLFTPFQIHITSFTIIKCEKMSWPSIIWHWDSNSQPLECESPPITTRPGLPHPILMFMNRLLMMEMGGRASNFFVWRASFLV